jgi:hypothetical protein
MVINNQQAIGLAFKKISVTTQAALQLPEA